LHPKYLLEVLGKKVVKNLEKGERFELKNIK
jgi:sialic acid synthase SpsE